MARPRTPKDDKSKHLTTILKEIEKRRAEAKKEGLNFTAPTEEELKERLRRVDTPMIISQGWSASATAGGLISYTVGIFNPDPVARGSLYVYVMVGPANMVREIGEALNTADERFPRLALPRAFGLVINPGAFAQLSFTISVPNVEDSNYLGNSFLFQGDYHDVGSYLDRGFFPFEVT
jgi:hypothetical protein